MPLHESYDRPILNAIEGYWRDFIRLSQKRKLVRAELIRIGESLDRLQRRRERCNAYGNRR